jgi:hypothetical protein
MRSAKVLAKLKGKPDTKAWIDSQTTKYNPADDPPILARRTQADTASVTRGEESHCCAPAPINPINGIKGPSGMYS